MKRVGSPLLPALLLAACSAAEASRPAARGEANAQAAKCERPAHRARCTEGFCKVEPGCFQMGAPRDEPGAGRFDVQVEVRLTRPFAIGQTEVTLAQWRALDLPAPRHERMTSAARCTEPSCPVVNVTFFDVLTYANRLSESQGLPACYELSECTGEIGELLDCASVRVNAESIHACRGYRLPTEAEWEYAARAGTSSAFFSGTVSRQPEYSCELDPALEDAAWYCHNAGGRAHPVGLKQPNALGLQDVLGNVAEYCNDVFDPRGYGEGPLTDPPGTLTPDIDLTPRPAHDPAVGKLRVVRGGSHLAPAVSCKASSRLFSVTEGTDSAIGFRVVRTL